MEACFKCFEQTGWLSFRKHMVILSTWMKLPTWTCCITSGTRMCQLPSPAFWPYRLHLRWFLWNVNSHGLVVVEFFDFFNKVHGLRSSDIIRGFCIRDQVYGSLSADGGGQYWALPRPMSLPNPNSKVHVLRLRNGALVCAHNHHGYRKVVGKGVTRVNLTIAISHNEGSTWNPLLVLEPMVRFHASFMSLSLS